MADDVLRIARYERIALLTRAIRKQLGFIVSLL